MAILKAINHAVLKLKSPMRIIKIHAKTPLNIKTTNEALPEMETTAVTDRSC